MILDEICGNCEDCILNEEKTLAEGKQVFECEWQEIEVDLSYTCDQFAPMDVEDDEDDDDYQADQAQMQASDYYEGNRERFG